MKNIFRRPDTAHPPKPEFADEIVKSKINAGSDVAAEEDYVSLITAQDNGEAAVIESILRAADIPYVIREKDSESWMRVMMGYNIFGSEFFVPEEFLDTAAALLVPEGAEGEDIPAGNADADSDEIADEIVFADDKDNDKKPEDNGNNA